MHKDLSPQQIQAALLLSEGITCKAVAIRVSVTPQTISAWRADLDFQVFTRRLQWEMVREHQYQMRAMTAEALSEIRSR